LQDLLNPDTALGRLAAAAVVRDDVAAVVRGQLPAALADEVRSCNLREDGTLVISVSSPAWAARLRFEAEHLLAAIRNRWPDTQRVLVRTTTDRGPENGPV
jgi:hypothetical protein